MTPAVKRLARMVALGLLFTSAHSASAHDAIKETEYENQAEFDKRVARVLAREPHKMDEGLRARAIYKIQKAALEAAGADDAAIAQALTTGPQRAFPFVAHPELKSHGAVKTLTILIDFKDHKAATLLPGLDANAFHKNIYGAGNPAFSPHDSVHNYYHRASQGKVDLQGKVLGWHHFAKDRKKYEPGEPPADTADEDWADAQATLDNAANFRLASEAMAAFDAAHDFAQYDNDSDGDIDLVTILYAGPKGDWAEFWWAYRWEFFVPESFTKKFDGKRLNQFVFQFVDTRGSSPLDFDPTTLLHEMGHAFGLADYYDYKPLVGPPGGVGGLDMMHANQGNQNAFSRWLLDWIDPVVIGSGAPANYQLKGPASPLLNDKAIAIFPGMVAGAPKQELFLVECRPKAGNDLKMPASGLLVWHIDATVHPSGTRFRRDNSETFPKLIRLVRADNPKDFKHNEPGGAGTYFTPGKNFTPVSIPNSNGYNDLITHIAMDSIAMSGDDATLRIGFLQPPGPAPAGLAGVGNGAFPVRTASAESAAPSDAADAQPTQGQPAEGQQPSEENLVASLADNSAAIDLDKLEELDRQLTAATPEKLRQIWNELGDASSSGEGISSASLTRQLVLTHWASKEGKPAVAALLETSNADEFVRQTFPQVMESWAHQAPISAAQWYLDEDTAQVRESKKLEAGTAFAQQIFKPLYLRDKEKAVKAIEKLDHLSEVVGAAAGSLEASKHSAGGADRWSDLVENLERNKKIVQATEKTIEAWDEAAAQAADAAADISNPTRRAEFQEAVGNAAE